MESPTDTHVKIRGEDVTVSPCPLKNRHVVIGRSHEADITIDHVAVSSRHAEILPDPFGRWWLRDLGSRNGTRINGQNVQEDVIRPSNEIEIGPYGMTYRIPEAATATSDLSATTSVILTDAASAKINLVADYESPRVGVKHLTSVTTFGQELLGMDNAHQRLDHLCSLMVSDIFHGQNAVVLQVEGRESHSPAQVLAEINLAGQTGYIPQSLLQAVRERLAPGMASNVNGQPDAIGLTVEALIQPMAGRPKPPTRPQRPSAGDRSSPPGPRPNHRDIHRRAVRTTGRIGPFARHERSTRPPELDLYGRDRRPAGPDCRDHYPKDDTDSRPALASGRPHVLAGPASTT